tara:strand:+ start:3714 stop:4730 length:1017 start_codon:yes stop_codon:yes gene_type:complete
MSYDLVGIGNALVDIQVMTDDSLIESLGLVKGGMTLSSQEDQVRLLKKLSGHSQKISSGGSAANTIHGMGILGANTYYLGRVANDDYGKYYSEDMQASGAGFSGPDIEESSTGTSVIMITPDGQRTMLTHLGISAELHPGNVDTTIVSSAKMVYIEGYLWTGDRSRAAASKMAETAQAAGIPVAFTLSDFFVAESFTKSLIDFVRCHVDILFCNEIEAKALTGKNETQKAFEELQAITKTLFVTLGSQGSQTATAEGESAVVKAFPVKVIDTTGAGDLYAAGALYGMLRKYSLEECAIIGSYCASNTVSHLGGRMPVHAHVNLAKIIKSYRELNKSTA